MSTETREAFAPGRYTLNGATMGTRYSAAFFAPEGVDKAVIGTALFAAVDVVDRQMSSWKPDSDLSRLNAAPTGEWVSVPRELASVLSASIRIGRMSDGAFDIGVGDLVNAWGFGADGPAIDAARIGVANGKTRKPAADILEVDEASMRIRKGAPITLDLSAIAKGFAVDELARCLDGFGLSNYLVGIDGEIRASGFKPGRLPWAVAVERPDRSRREALGVVDLANMAIATSGDYRHWIDIGGETISHTMDARRSGPLRNAIASVTVMARSCMDADALATALMVLGEHDGPAFARTHGFDALFLLRNGDRLREVAVGKFGCADD
jgi:FAD:protein FMN transferase